MSGVAEYPELSEGQPIQRLYSLTGVDWVLEVNHILTETVCPTAVIRAEDDTKKWPSFRSDQDTISASIACVLKQAAAWASTLQGDQ